MKKKITALVLTFATTLINVLLQTPIRSIPAIGELINPWTGFWQNMENDHLTEDPIQSLKDLNMPVIVKYDRTKVPHITAKNEHDLYFMQGYLTAKDRLWQMDIQSRKAAGRLAEILGKKWIPSDLYYRKIGLTYAAERSLTQMMSDPLIRTMLLAYSEGVNAYIARLSAKDYPLEYKILGYRPEKWRPINTALLLKLMTETLTGGSDDLAMSNTLTILGSKAMADLYPDEDFRKSPVIPMNTAWNFHATVDTASLAAPQLHANKLAGTWPRKRIEGIGSNNWVVNGSKTKSGFPILANDPHLDLTYPSIWYQVQLHAPGINVFGVSIPGIPCVLSGFTKDIAWGVTNVDADVLDWYQETFRKNNKEYLYNNRWIPVVKRVEKILVKDGRTLTDTVIYTGHGPVVYTLTEHKPTRLREAFVVPQGYALKWIGHESSSDLKAFYLLNRSKNYADYRYALTFYAAPAQNFVFASNTNDIAITVNGKFPVKNKDQGKYLLNGTRPTDNWHGWIPMNEVPSSVNPVQGYLSSANQFPTDKTYPYYLNWQFAPPERAIRINQKLASMEKITLDSMINLQNDTYSILAEEALPAMLKMMNPSTLNVEQKNCYQQLLQWDKCYRANSIGATIFNAFWNEFYKGVWANKFNNQTLVKYPSRDRTLQLLLKEPNSLWFDNLQSRQKETCFDAVKQAFGRSTDSLNHKFGKMSTKWEWGMSRPIFINHLAGLTGFGSGRLNLGGGVSTVNAIAPNHGPSWRIIVELGQSVTAYGILPGGESGNPGSFYYDNLLKDWERGKLRRLVFLTDANSSDSDIISTITYSN